MGWGPFDFNLFDLSDEEKAKIKGLPKSLEEALDALESDYEFLTRGGVFPERLIKIWIQRKRKEAEAIARIPHPANSRSITICKPKHQKDRYCCRSSPIYIKSPNRALTVFYIFDTGFSALRLRHLIMAILVLISQSL